MSILSKLLSALSLLALISCNVRQPAAQQSPTAAPIAQDLIGTWSFSGGGGGDPTLLAFTPQGKLLVLQAIDNQTLATQFNYAIDPQARPMLLDLKPQKPQVAEQEIAKTLFDITAKGELVLPPLAAMKPAQPRPNQIVGGVTYRKVSDETTLRSQVNQSAVEPSQPEQSASTAGLTHLKMLAIAQQAYYLDNGKLASSLQQLGDPLIETTNYRYQINFQGSELVFVTAQAKQPNLQSLTSIVFKLKPATVGYDVVYATGCQTIKPTLTPPALPIVDFETGKIKCPGGTQEY